MSIGSDSPNPSAVGSDSKLGVAASSVLASFALTLGKLVIGLLTGSIAVLAEAAHSGLDLAATVMTFFAVRAADFPSDANHPYGHYKFENLSALFETFLLFATCGWISYEAIQRLLAPFSPVDRPYLGAMVLVSSIAVDLSRSRALSKAAKKHESQALEADALHFFTDILSSATALLGVALASLGPRLGFPLLVKADAVAALLVAIITFVLSWKLGVRAFRVLADEIPPLLQKQLEAAVRQVEGVHPPIRVRARQSGNRTFVDVIAHASDDLSMTASHLLADQIEEAIRAHIAKSDIVVHLEPVGEHRSTHSEP
jgi:cation diffusion facilitator family transporter